jgi:hypothetical protein
LTEIIVKNIFKYLPNRIFEKQYQKLIDLNYLNEENGIQQQFAKR